MRKLAWISVAILALACSGCKQKTGPGQIGVKISQRVLPEATPAVSFGLQPVGKQTSDHWKYMASYTRHGKTALFGIDLQLAKSQGDAGVRVGSGSFVADPQSDDSLLIEDLEQALKATTAPDREVRVRELPFRFEILGENLDRGRQGNLVDAATGNWVSARLYLGVHQDKEVLLNFQKPGGTGEFVNKDPQFGNDVLKELAKVL